MAESGSVEGRVEGNRFEKVDDIVLLGRQTSKVVRTQVTQRELKCISSQPIHRVDFGEPVNKHAALCSAHFEQSCYSTSLSLEGMEEWKRNKVLIKGSIPTRHTVLQTIPKDPSDCKRRQLSLSLSQAEQRGRKGFMQKTSTALTTVDTAPTVTTPAVAIAAVSAAVTVETDAPAEESGDFT
ncbi:hypothetical protein ACROYT_G004883 [Oculina patagonica]